MSTRIERYSSYFRYLFLIFLYLAITLTTLNTFMDRVGFRGDSPRYGFRATTEYQAEKPFCYRVLVPLLINGTYSLFPQDFIEKISDKLTEDSGLLRYVQIEEDLDAALAAKYHLAYFLLALTILGLLLLLRKITKTVFSSDQLLTDIAPVIALLFLPMNLQHGGYFYDYLEILFCLAAVVLLMKRNFIGYYLILPLAVLNKGTGIFLILYYIIILFEERSTWKFRLNVLSQLAITIPIIIGVRIYFADNPDPSYPISILANLKFWINPSSYVKLYEIYAPLIEIPTGANILFLLFVVYLVLYRFKEKELLIRRLFLWPLIGMIPLFLLFGNRDEFRVLSPVLPGLYLLGFGTITELYRRLNKKDPKPAGFESQN